MDRVTQCDKILDYMYDHDGITQIEATYNLGITRLPARISDLKKKGCNFTTTKEKHEGGYHVRYRLAEVEQCI